MFTKVLKKFFTDSVQYENKRATELNALIGEDREMLNDILNTARRAPAAFLQDLFGAAALVVLLVGSLYLPALT